MSLSDYLGNGDMVGKKVLLGILFHRGNSPWILEILEHTSAQYFDTGIFYSMQTFVSGWDALYQIFRGKKAEWSSFVRRKMLISCYMESVNLILCKQLNAWCIPVP